MSTVEPGPRSCCGTARPAIQVPPPPPVDGRFELTDHFGQVVTERDFGHRWLLLFFGFVHCQVVCPRELAKLAQALALLGPAGERIQPLFVTLDPERDSPAALRSHLSRQAPGFIGLTGSVQVIEDTRKRFRVFTRKVVDAQAPGGYVLPHTAFAYLLKPGGGCLAHFSDSLSAGQLAERLRSFLV